MAWGRGHRYATVVYQIDRGCKRLLWLGEHRKAKTLLRFFRWFGRFLLSYRPLGTSSCVMRRASREKQRPTPNARRTATSSCGSSNSPARPWPTGEPLWGDAEISLPDNAAGLRTNAFTGETWDVGSGLRAADALAHFPVGVLLKPSR